MNGSVSSIDVYEKCKHRNSLTIGMYWPQILNGERSFGKEQFLVISSDAMINEPSTTQRQVYAHLQGLGVAIWFLTQGPHSNEQSFPGKLDS